MQFFWFFFFVCSFCFVFFCCTVVKQKLASHAVNLEDAVLAIASTCKDCKLHNTVALLSLSNKVISYFQQFKLSFTTETPACVQESKQRDTRSIGSLFTTAAIKFLCSLITCSVLVIQTWWPLQPSIHSSITLCGE